MIRRRKSFYVSWSAGIDAVRIPPIWGEGALAAGEYWRYRPPDIAAASPCLLLHCLFMCPSHRQTLLNKSGSINGWCHYSILTSNIFEVWKQIGAWPQNTPFSSCAWHPIPTSLWVFCDFCCICYVLQVVIFTAFI